MARILVKTIDAESLDQKKNSLLYKRGDVVKVVGDGYHFGTKIETDINPKFAIVELPGVPASNLVDLVTPKTTGTGDDLQIVQRRVRSLDLSSMTAKELSDLEGAQRKATLSEGRLTELTEIKA